jgi:hypothetical protein
LSPVCILLFLSLRIGMAVGLNCLATTKEKAGDDQGVAFKAALCTVSNYYDPFDNLIKSPGYP